MTGTHILILGGTAEARQLATELAVPGGAQVTTSLAGRVARPRMPAGDVRIGGFGGAEDWPSGCAPSAWTPSWTPPIRSLK